MRIFILGGVHTKYIFILGGVRYHCPTGKSVFLSESVFLTVYLLSGVDFMLSGVKPMIR